MAVSYVLIVTFNILIVTKTSINDFTDAALWPLLFLTAYEVTAQNCISEVSLFRILKITKLYVWDIHLFWSLNIFWE